MSDSRWREERRQRNLGVWCSPSTSLPVCKCILPMLNSLSLGWWYIIFWEVFTKWIVRLFTWGLSPLVVFTIYSLIMTLLWRSEYRCKNLNRKGKSEIYKSLPQKICCCYSLYILIIFLHQYFIAMGISLLALARCLACNSHLFDICSWIHLLHYHEISTSIFVCFLCSGEKNSEWRRVQWNSVFSVLKTLDWKFWFPVPAYGESEPKCVTNFTFFINIHWL